MRPILAVLAVAALGACSSSAASQAGSAPPAAAKASSAPPSRGDIRSRCAGFGAAQAAEILGVPAGEVTDASSDIGPSTRACEFVAGGRKISFSISVENSGEAAQRVLENAKEGYEIALRAQEKAIGKAIPEGAYSDILGVADEVIWSVTNGSMLGRQKNVTFLVMWPSGERRPACAS